MDNGMTESIAKKLNFKLFGKNPFEVECHEPTRFVDEGWASYPEVLGTVIDVVKPTVIIEVGVWLGQSTFNMLDQAIVHDLSASIICIDTWLGSPEHWLNPKWNPQLRIQNGRPNLYSIFVSNVLAKGYQESIVPMNMTSSQAAKILLHHNLVADLVYIDGAHDKDEVNADIENYWPFLKLGGCMVGDDYSDNWPGVVEAVHEFQEGRDDIEFVHVKDKFVLYKI